MEDMLGIVIAVIALVVSTIVKGSNKNKAQQAKPVQAKKPEHPYTAVQKAAAPAKAAPAQKAPTAAPVQLMMEMPKPAAFTPAQVSIHAHIAPACEEHDAPSGSMQTVSPEGKDPCHEEQMAPREDFPVLDEEANPLELEWSGENMVKAFIMQEVLTRPHQRRVAR